jgi:predicted ester cyclase
MGFDLDGLLRLWMNPLPQGEEAEEAFHAFYTDPVKVNGRSLHAADLVERARCLQAALADAEREVLEVVEAGGKLAVAFRLAGRHAGPFRTAAGELAPTGRRIELRVIDILTITDGRISEVWMAADELGALAAIDAVTLRR